MAEETPLEWLGDNFYVDGPNKGEPLTGRDAMRRVRQETDHIILAFSGGKDSIAAWLVAREFFPPEKITPVHRMILPDLEFMHRRMDYYEGYFGQKIFRVPSPAFYNILTNYVFQPLHRVGTIASLGIPPIDYVWINQFVIQEFNLPDSTFVVAGVRAADSMQRRATAKSRGPINWNERMCWNVWDMTNMEMTPLFRKHNVKLPRDYEFWGTSFDGLRWFFLREIKERYPEDYQRILEWLPFADMEFFRRTLVGGTTENE
jgi:hypothetical protein